MGDLGRLLTFKVGAGIILALGAGLQATFTEIHPCDTWTDFLTGCGSTGKSMLASLAFTTIPGPSNAFLALANLALATIVNGLVLIAFLDWLRGRNAS